jgi:ribosomal protein RSM22 (predicted rRNA methylase)
MPATYAAVSAALAALAEARPDFQPVSMIDAGAGPGTATWAAAATFAALDQCLLLDANAALSALARTLIAGHPRLANAGFRLGNVQQLIGNAPDADLVVASYMVGELAEQQCNDLAALIWERTRDTLLVVEPGTPGGYSRIMSLRERLIGDGAHVLAPCPHDKPCPLVAPDWCRFSQRLPRTRDHMLMKDANAPFEDERFAYVALSRTPAEARRSRVLAQPHASKAAIEAKLCTADGAIASSTIARRDKPAYASARRWRWGDSV